MAMQGAVQRRSYLPLNVLLAVALLPLFGAMLSYFGGIGVPDGRVNQGQLVVEQPPFELQHQQGGVVERDGRWQLLLMVERCEEFCLQWQQRLEKLHRLLGRERPRVVLRLVLPNQDAISALEAVAIQADKPPPESFISASANKTNQGVWLLDPLGNRVLRYSLDQQPKQVLKDLKRLLKVSRIG